MTNTTRPVSPLCRRYAQSLLDVALQSKAESKVMGDMEDLSAMLSDERVFADFIAMPFYSRKEQMAVIDALAAKAKFNATTLNFLKLLVENKRLSELEGMINAYRAVMSEHNDEVSVDVKTAYELQKKQIDDLTKTLESNLGKNVKLKQTVEKDLLGGMIVTIGSVMVDDSVKGKLERLKLSLKTGTNENTNMKEVG